MGRWKIGAKRFYHFLNYKKLEQNRNYFEIIQHFSFTYVFVWIRKLDFDSLTETKNWGGRSEIIEVSGRPHL